jgi:hypothetical protein
LDAGTYLTSGKYIENSQKTHYTPTDSFVFLSNKTYQGSDIDKPFWVANHGDSNRDFRFIVGPNFGVTKNGVLFASAAYLHNIVLTGDINIHGDLIYKVVATNSDHHGQASFTCSNLRSGFYRLRVSLNDKGQDYHEILFILGAPLKLSHIGSFTNYSINRGEISTPENLTWGTYTTIESWRYGGRDFTSSILISAAATNNTDRSTTYYYNFICKHTDSTTSSTFSLDKIFSF